MGRLTRPDLEKRFVTYVNAAARHNRDEWRVVSWVRGNISKGAFDFGLGMAGAGTAVASLIFAGVMMSGDTSHPAFGGAEYLLLFTRPLQHAGSQPIGPRNHEPQGIDFTTTGSIGSAARLNNGDPSGVSTPPDPNATAHPAVSASVKDYVLKSVTGGVAAIKSSKGDFVVETGSFLPNGDLVVSIDRRAGRWVVVTSGGLIESR
jgi:hypothetical protein